MAEPKPTQYTRTMSALLCPESERVLSYLWLTHRVHNHQLRFVVNEYLHLRRAAEIARAGGDIERALAGRHEEGAGRVRRHFEEFVRRFEERYGLSREDATEVALKLGEMSDRFLVAPDDVPWEIPDGYKVHGIMNQLTQLSTSRGNIPRKSTCAKNDKSAGLSEEQHQFLVGLHKQGILLFDRLELLCLASGRQLQRIDVLFDQAARHIRSTGQQRKKRDQDIAEWKKKRREWLRENRDWLRRAKRFFMYEKQRDREHEEGLRKAQPHRKMRSRFVIRGRSIKGIRELLQRWKEEKLWDTPPESPETRPNRIARRLELVRELQEENPELFGDHRVFEWLAQHADDWPEFPADFELMIKYNKEYHKDRRPKAIGFSQPHWRTHPVWYELEERGEPWGTTKSNKEKQYVLPLDDQVIEMMLIVPVEDAVKGRPWTWDRSSGTKPPLTEQEIEAIVKDPKKAALVAVPIPFKPDRRLLSLVRRNPDGPVLHGWGPSKSTFNYLYRDDMLGRDLPFRFGGLKVMWVPRPVSRTGSRPYVYFSTKTLVDSPKYVKLKEGVAALPPGTRVMAVDVGYRHAAYAVIREYDGKDPIGRQIWAGSIKAGGGRHLRKVEKHQRDRSAMISKATTVKTPDGKSVQRSLPRGKSFDKAGREHIDHLKDDLAKQTAFRIIEKALKHNVRLILFENLEGYTARSSRSRRENRRLATLRSLVHQLGEYKTKGAKEGTGADRSKLYRLQFWDKINAAWTSAACHKCGEPGRRFDELTAKYFTDREGKPIESRKWRGTAIPRDRVGAVRIIGGGPLFCCSNPDCPVVKINADYNGAQNILRGFATKQKALLKPPKKGTKASKQYWADVEEKVRAKLRERGFRLADEGLETQAS